MDIKERMANVGMTQVDMILELQKRGYAVQPPMMSSILRFSPLSVYEPEAVHRRKIHGEAP